MSDIVSLIWALAGLIGTVSVATYLWRNPRASASIKHKGSELALNPSGERPAHADAVLPELATEQPDQLPAGGQGQLSGTEVEQETRFAKAYRLLTTNEYDAGREVLEEVAKNEDGRDKRVSLLAFGQHLAAVRGSAKALGDLRGTASANPDVFEAHLWLGVALRELGRTDDAIAVFEAAFTAATTDDDRAAATVWSVDPLVQTHDIRGVARRILDRVNGLHDHSARARIVARAAKLHLELTPPDLERAFALYESAIALDPSDASLRFDVAHAYGEHGGETPAFVHYARLLERDSSHASTANNLGVAASNLEMESIAVAHYKQAEQLGNTLATANLAWKLINAGFLAEARTKLDSAASKPDTHRNVLSALGGIAKTESSDEEKKTAVMKRAGWYREIAVQVGDAMIANGGPTAGLVGSYVQGSTKLEAHCPTADSVAGTISSVFDTREFAGLLIGSALIISWWTRKPAQETLLTSWALSKKGCGVLVMQGAGLEGYTYEGDRAVDPTQADGYTEWRFQRAY